MALGVVYFSALGLLLSLRVGIVIICPQIRDDAGAVKPPVGAGTHRGGTTVAVTLAAAHFDLFLALMDTSECGGLRTPGSRARTPGSTLSSASS